MPYNNLWYESEIPCNFKFPSLVKIKENSLKVVATYVDSQGRIQGGGGGGALGAEAPPPFIFRLYLINMLSIIMKFCLSIII